MQMDQVIIPDLTRDSMRMISGMSCSWGTGSHQTMTQQATVPFSVTFIHFLYRFMFRRSEDAILFYFFYKWKGWVWEFCMYIFFVCG